MRQLSALAYSTGTTLLVIMAAACSSQRAGPSPSPVADTAIRVLTLPAPAGFRHDSIPTARQVMSDLAAGGEFRVSATEDLSAINASSLSTYDVVFFALTSGELPFTDDQKTALVNFVRSGGGFIGA